MAYQDSDPRGLAGPAPGCGAACGCSRCASAARRLGESYETDDDDEADSQAAGAGGTRVGEVDTAAPALRRAAPAPAMAALVATLRSGGIGPALQQLLRDGVRDENRLADLLFFARHPERQGRRIAAHEVEAARHWRAIREQWVRPGLRALRGQPPGAAPRPPVPARPTLPPLPAAPGACPVEDPVPQLPHPVGRVCSAAGRKCWPASGKSLDIVDADLPCTGQRSAQVYRAVLAYFNVADSANLRYARTPTSTYCNIFAHDATRALRASIPHWVRDARQQRSRPLGWRELNANATFDWLVQQGPAAGWMPISPPLVAAIRRLAAGRGGAGAGRVVAGRALDAALAQLPTALAEAAQRIAQARHDDPSLLAQDGYLAQQFANLGLPTVVSWKNPRGGPGHIAMVSPEAPGSLAVRHPSGMVLPRTTQAGARNFENGIDAWIAGANTRSRRFFVHA